MTYYDPNLGQGAAAAASAHLSESQSKNINAAANSLSAGKAGGGELPWGTWFDETYDLRDPEGGTFTDEVIDCIAASETRKRKRRPKDAQNHYLITRSILANVLRCQYHRYPPLVAFTSGAGQQYYRSTPVWLNGEAMKRTLTLLERAGLVTVTTGRWGEASSTYAATPDLLEIAACHGITASSLMAHRLNPARLVRLYEQKSGNSSLMAFTPTEETEYWTAQLAEYNAFIAGQHIALVLSGAEQAQWVARWNTKRNDDSGTIHRPKVIRPELIRTDLYRSFNNGWNEQFMEGGRLYGSWWMNTPSDLRKKITINDRPVIEADYSCCQPRMLYHRRGIEYLDDCYALDPLITYARSIGLPEDHYREAVKAMMQALVNGDSRDKLELAPLKNGYCFDPFEPIDVRRMIESKHQAITDDFGTGVGLHLQRKDSDLALTIITNLMRQGIVALPVHDAFMVAEEHLGSLIEEMEAAYRTMFSGYIPIIKVG